LIVFPRCIEHHFDNVFDIAICRFERTYINPEAPRDRGPDLLGVQLFAFDFTAFENVRS
jgi:hypothetical protein